MSTSTATAYEYNVAGHLSFGAPKCEKAQKSSGFWANRTYRLCIKDNVLIDPVCGSGHCHIVPYWAHQLGKKELVAYQASKRGGTLYCRQKGDKVFLAGQAALFSVAELNI